MKFTPTKRKPLNLSTANLIQTELLPSGNPLPLVVTPAVEGIDAITWATNNRDWIETHLLKHGGLLFRNFNLTQATGFENFLRAISGELLEYKYGSTPRTNVKGNIYTSTEYPPAQIIPMHNEMAYSRNWPMKIGFFCVQPSETGGETPIADSRKVFQNLDPRIKEKFVEKQVMYVRNYSQQFDLPWQTVFQTQNKSEVEKFCRSANIEWEWINEEQLRTRQVCQAIATHPKTKETVWFNQAHLFHISRLDGEVKETLLSTFKTEDLPRNAYYGDGSTIEDSIVDEINEVYQQEAILFPWQAGDILLLDNMLAAHGRMPFTGSRKVLVGMTES